MTLQAILSKIPTKVLANGAGGAGILIWLIKNLPTIIDDIMKAYVSTISTYAATAVGSILGVSLTVHFSVLALKILQGESQEPMKMVVKDVVSKAFILGLGLTLSSYQTLVIEGTTALMELMTFAVTGGSTTSAAEAIGDIFRADAVTLEGNTYSYWAALWFLADKFSYPIGIPNLTYLVAGALVFIAQVLVASFCLIPYILSKIYIAIMLAIGPFFIFSLLFPITKSYFTNWLSGLIGNVLSIVIVAVICSIIPVTFNAILATSIVNPNPPDTNPLDLGIGVLTLGICLAFVALKATQIGSQLAGGGVAMDGSGVIATFTQMLVTRSLINNRSDNKPDAPGGEIKQAPAGQRAGQAISSQTSRLIQSLTKRK